MKNVFFLPLLVVLLSSCSTYFYSYVNSYGDTLEQKENGDYVKSGDNVRITYSFSQQDGEVIYEIENKSENPITVDWNRSVLSVNDNVYQRNSNANFKGRVNVSSISSSSIGTVSGSVELPNDKLYIPAQTKARYVPISLSSLFNTQTIPNSSFSKDFIGISEVKAADFTEENSPLVFKSHLTIIDEKEKSESIVEDTFYISRVIKMKEENDFLVDDARNKGNMFYIKR